MDKFGKPEAYKSVNSSSTRFPFTLEDIEDIQEESIFEHNDKSMFLEMIQSFAGLFHSSKSRALENTEN